MAMAEEETQNDDAEAYPNKENAAKFLEWFGETHFDDPDGRVSDLEGYARDCEDGCSQLASPEDCTEDTESVEQALKAFEDLIDDLEGSAENAREAADRLDDEIHDRRRTWEAMRDQFLKDPSKPFDSEDY